MTAFGWFRSKGTPKGLPDGPLHRFLEAQPQDASATPEELKLLAIDLETTGLDPATDVILSTGYVPVEGLALDFSGAGGMLASVNVEVGQSAIFHGLTDDCLTAGRPLADVIDDVLNAMAGRILLAHHAAIECGFLTRAIEQLHGIKVTFERVDTMQLAHKLLAQGFDEEPKGEDLRLWRSRGRYGLPRYRGHDALTDAIACAELFLAQAAELGSVPWRKLKKVAR